MQQGSGEYYHSYFEFANEAIIITDLHGLILDYNQMVREMFEVSGKELLGSNLSAIIELETICQWQKDLKSVGNKKLIHARSRTNSTKGQALELELQHKSVGDRIIISIRDITVLKRTERERAISESIYKAAFENSAVAMVLVTQNGFFFKVNRAFCKLTGYSEVELLNKTFSEITHPDDLEENLLFIKNALCKSSA